MPAQNDISDWFTSIPYITRWWFGLSIIVPLMGRFGLLPAYYMVLLFKQLIFQFQFWRPFTAAVYFPISPMTGFQYLINLYFLYTYSTYLETGVYDGRPADYLFLILFNWMVLVVVGLLIGLMLLMESLILSVMYVWCQLNADVIVTFWFGMKFKAMYLPWVFAGLNFILRGGGVNELIGILVGHLYYFLKYRYPEEYGGRELIHTPEFLYQYFPSRRGGVSGFGVPPASSRRQPGNNNDRRHDWGAGHQLGGH